MVKKDALNKITVVLTRSARFHGAWVYYNEPRKVKITQVPTFATDFGHLKNTQTFQERT
jgi:hypothetical protein